MRELRHDFRRIYGIAYDDVPLDEAVDLVLTLPRGSLYRASKRPYGEWTAAEESAADIVDSIERLIALYASGTTEGSQRKMRPQTLEAADRERERAERARRRIEETVWEEV